MVVATSCRWVESTIRRYRAVASGWLAGWTSSCVVMWQSTEANGRSGLLDGSELGRGKIHRGSSP